MNPRVIPSMRGQEPERDAQPVPVPTRRRVKGSDIIRLAKERPDLTQKEIAAALGSTPKSVNVILHRARRAGLLEFREIDSPRKGRGRTAWLPDEYRKDYKTLRAFCGAVDARLLIEKRMRRDVS